MSYQEDPDLEVDPDDFTEAKFEDEEEQVEPEVETETEAQAEAGEAYEQVEADEVEEPLLTRDDFLDLIDEATALSLGVDVATFIEESKKSPHRKIAGRILDNVQFEYILSARGSRDAAGHVNIPWWKKALIGGGTLIGYGLIRMVSIQRIVGAWRASRAGAQATDGAGQQTQTRQPGAGGG